MQRRGIIVGTTESEGFVRVDADVPVGRVAAWILGVEEQGQRGKAS